MPKWLIGASVFVLLGAAVFAGAMTVLGWDFTKLSTTKYETNNHEITEDYQSIAIVAKTADIVILPSESAQTTVVCYEQHHAKHSVTVSDGTLVIRLNDTRKWYEYIGFNFDSPKITLTVPQKDFDSLSIRVKTGDIRMETICAEKLNFSTVTGDLKLKDLTCQSLIAHADTGNITFKNINAAQDFILKTDTGDIRLEAVFANKLDIAANTGDLKLTDLTCQTLIAETDTGNISLKNAIAAEDFFLETDTGDIHFDGSDAARIQAKTDTGDITGTLLSEKVFITSSDTGSINVPKTITGGKCELTTDTGDIKIKIQEG